MNPQTLKKLTLYKNNPELIKEISNQELADLVVVVLGAVNQIENAIKDGRLDGFTPRPDKEYLGIDTARKMLSEAVNDMVKNYDFEMRAKGSALEMQVQAAIERIRDGEDGIVSDEEIQRAAEIAFSLIEMPDFEKLVETALTSSSYAVRDSLELIQEEEQKLEMTAVKDLLKTIEELRSEITKSKGVTGGGIGKNTVLQLIAENGGGVSDGDKGDITVSGDSWTINDAAVQMDDIDATGTPSSSTFLRGDGSWATPAGSGDMAKAVYDTNDDGIVDEAAVITSQGALATQDTVTESQISDLKNYEIKAVANGSLTAANDTFYVCVSSSTFTDPTPTEGEGYAVLVRNGTATIGGTGYSTAGTIIRRTFHSGAWASYVYLNTTQLASTYQPLDSDLTTIAAANNGSVLAATTASFTTADETKLDGIEPGADVTDTTNVTAAGALMDSEVTDLAGIKSLVTSTLQVKPAEGAFVDGDKTKLDGIEALADVTDATNVSAAGAPIISSGAGAPASTPTKVGDIYIDTTNDDAYIAVGTASSSDWEKSNDGGGAGGGTLDQSYDYGGSGSGRSITADSGAVDITVPDTSNTPGLIINQNDVTNNPNALIINSNVGASATTSSQHPLLVKSTSTGGIGAFIGLYQDSASAAISDQPGGVGIFGNNSSAGEINYGGFSVSISDPTAASEDSYIILYTQVAGANTVMLTIHDGVNGISVGDSVSAGVVESRGDTDLTLQTGNSTTGYITIVDGANGNINIAPNGTGEAQVSGNKIIDETDAAVASDVNTGSSTTTFVTPSAFQASKRNIRWLSFNLVEAATDCATGTNLGGDFVSPIAGTILQSDTTPFYLYATNSTAGTTGNMVVDININGTSIMTTNKLSFDSTEKTTTTSATPPDLTTTSLAVGDIITINVGSVHTTAAKGLTVYMAVLES